MAKIRVHELAKKLERTNREVMDALKGIGVDVKSHRAMWKIHRQRKSEKNLR